LHPFDTALRNAQSPEGMFPLFYSEENVDFWNIQCGRSKFDHMYWHESISPMTSLGVFQRIILTNPNLANSGAVSESAYARLDGEHLGQS
jgi:hypothetical protein